MTEFDFKQMVRDVTNQLLYPRLRQVCICPDPKPGEYDYITQWATCQMCGYDVSRQMAMERNYGYD